MNAGVEKAPLDRRTPGAHLHPMLKKPSPRYRGVAKVPAISTETPVLELVLAALRTSRDAQVVSAGEGHG
ncbi:hypothetical protein Q0Z83_042650 [Actinoplanes sichuanensis]|nr:hypothetical protein Q0Z83_042650 [Actinoplanes sichuanensis]